ncbi:MAG: hypothetical protein IME99_01685 [Proteobacteria bacterium]|nr:hypothetical protein [Pseudomonadota bacterium]
MITKRLRGVAFAAVLSLGMLFSGCGALPITFVSVLPAMVSGAGGGIAYSMTNVAYQTFSYPIGRVTTSIHSALAKMEIPEDSTTEIEDGVEIVALTRKLTIYIEVEEITPATTRVKVNAKRGTILKDKATAKEVLVQIGAILAKIHKADAEAGA